MALFLSLVNFLANISIGDVDSVDVVHSPAEARIGRGGRSNFARTRRASPSERACGFEVSSSVRAGICARRAPSMVAGGWWPQGVLCGGAECSSAAQGVVCLGSLLVKYVFPGGSSCGGRPSSPPRRRLSGRVAGWLLVAARSPAGPARVGAAEHDVESLRGARYTAQIALRARFCGDRAPRVAVLPQQAKGGSVA